MNPLPPATTAFGRYEVERSIGRGGLGEVFRAWDAQLQRRVAVKRLVPSAGGGDALAEARCLAALQHPNIVGVHEVGADEDGPFLVMELVEGETLEAALARGPLALEDFLALARQTLEGLAAVHAADLFHRDLKPGNLMVRRGPAGRLQVKLLDFGIARHTREPEIGAGPDSVLGAIEYLPPELLERQPFERRSDLYALGCIFYRALAGRCPFRGATVDEVMASHLQGRVERLGAVRPDLPAALCRWVMDFISRLPVDRPRSAREALGELDRLLSALPQARRRWRRIVLAASSALAGLAAGWLLRGGHVQPPPPAPSAPPAQAQEIVYRADDLESLRPLADKLITVEGTVAAVRRSPADRVCYLNFAADYRQAVTLVFFEDALPEGASVPQLQSCQGRTVRARGRLKVYRGALQLVVQRADQWEIR